MPAQVRDAIGTCLTGARTGRGEPGADSLAGRIRSRLGLDLPAQAAIRLTVAVATAAAVGSILSERRFYWAVIAGFIAFIGANTTGEQVTKAINRVGGTVVGILVGSLLAHAIGDSTGLRRVLHPRQLRVDGDRGDDHGLPALRAAG